MSREFKRYLGVGAAVLLALAGSSALAAPTYVFSTATSSDIPGLTGFSTTGAMMDGMTVRAEFVDGFFETRLWADTGASSGGVTGSNWSLSQSGDTFGSPWTFLSTNTAPLRRLTLSGNTGLTVFDVDMYQDQAPCDTYTPTGNDQECSPGSARGARMVFGTEILSPTVTYSDVVGIATATPIGDLFHVVTVDFGPNGVTGTFTFTQDTDNDNRFGVPLPGTAALLGLGLGLLGLTRRRQS